MNHDYRGVGQVYDTVAEDYATHIPDTRAEAPLDLAMVDAFIACAGRTTAPPCSTPDAEPGG